MGMNIKYNRVSTVGQTGDRFLADESVYDLVMLDKISGSVPFKERPYGSQLMEMVERGEVATITVEEFSRLGRNTGDVITTLEYLDEMNVNVVVRNIGLQSRPNGERNPIWKMISSVMSSLYEMEKSNIAERTAVGRMVYVQKGGRLGRPNGTVETPRTFLDKPKCREIERLLRRGLRYAEIQRIVDCSPKTIRKVKTMMEQAV